MLTLGSRHGFVITALAALLVGCGPAFSTTGTGGGSSSGTGGQGGDGAGDATSSVGGGSSSTGQTGCTPGDLSTCPAGQYCDAETLSCASCADTARFAFGEPQSMNVTSPGAVQSAFAPRVAANGRLFFQTGPTFTKGDLAYADPDPSGPEGFPSKWSAAGPMPGQVNTAFDEGGPLLLMHGGAVKYVLDESLDPTQPILLFHQESGTGRRLVATNLGGSEVHPLLLLTPGKSDLEVAAALPGATGRLWYMSNVFTNGGEEELVTASDGDKPKKAPLVLEDGCHAKGHLFPWVTLDGKLMVHQARELDPNTCNPPLGVAFHLYWTPLDPGTGLQPGDAKSRRIFVKDEGDMVTPSLSPDMCTLYFSKMAVSGAGELYMAVRR